MRRALELVKSSTQFLSRFSLGGSLSVQDTADEDNKDSSPSLLDVGSNQEETNGIDYKSSVGEGMASTSSELQLSVDDLNSMSYEQIKITDMNVKDLKAALVKEGFKPPNSFNKKQCVEKLGQLVVEKQLQENRTKTAAMTTAQSSSSASNGTLQSSAKRRNKPQEVDAGSVPATTASSSMRSTRTRGSSKKGSNTESTLAAEDDEKDDTMEEFNEHATAMDIDESKPSKAKSTRGQSKKTDEMVTEAVPSITSTSARSSRAISENSKKSVEEAKDGSSTTIPTAVAAVTMAVGGRGSRSKKTIADGLAPEAAAAPSESVVTSSSVTGKRTRGKANHEEEPAALVASEKVDAAASRGSRKRMKPSPSDVAPLPAVDSASMVATAAVAKSTRSTRSAPVVANVLPTALPDQRHQQSMGVSETSGGGRARSARSATTTKDTTKGGIAKNVALGPSADHKGKEERETKTSARATSRQTATIAATAAADTLTTIAAANLGATSRTAEVAAATSKTAGRAKRGQAEAQGSPGKGKGASSAASRDEEALATLSSVMITVPVASTTNVSKDKVSSGANSSAATSSKAKDLARNEAASAAAGPGTTQVAPIGNTTAVGISKISATAAAEPGLPLPPRQQRNRSSAKTPAAVTQSAITTGTDTAAGTIATSHTEIAAASVAAANSSSSSTRGGDSAAAGVYVPSFKINAFSSQVAASDVSALFGASQSNQPPRSFLSVPPSDSGKKKERAMLLSPSVVPGREESDDEEDDEDDDDDDEDKGEGDMGEGGMMLDDHPSLQEEFKHGISSSAIANVGAGMGQLVGSAGVDGWLQQQQSTGSKAGSTASNSRRGGAVGGPGHREPSSYSTGDRHGQFAAGEGSAVDESGSGGMGLLGLSGTRRFSSYVDHGHGSSDESFVAAANAYAGMEDPGDADGEDCDEEEDDEEFLEGGCSRGAPYDDMGQLPRREDEMEGDDEYTAGEDDEDRFESDADNNNNNNNNTTGNATAMMMMSGSMFETIPTGAAMGQGQGLGLLSGLGFGGFGGGRADDPVVLDLVSSSDDEKAAPAIIRSPAAGAAAAAAASTATATAMTTSNVASAGSSGTNSVTLIAPNANTTAASAVLAPASVTSPNTAARIGITTSSPHPPTAATITASASASASATTTVTTGFSGLATKASSVDAVLSSVKAKLSSSEYEDVYENVLKLVSTEQLPAVGNTQGTHATTTAKENHVPAAGATVRFAAAGGTLSTDPSRAAATTTAGTRTSFGATAGGTSSMLLQPTQWSASRSSAGTAQGLAQVSAPPMAALPFSSPLGLGQGTGLVRTIGGKRGFDDMMTARAGQPPRPYEEEVDRDGMSEAIYRAAKRQSFGANMPSTSMSMALLMPSSSSAHINGMSGIKAAKVPDSSSSSSSYMPVFKDPSLSEPGLLGGPSSTSSGVLLQPSQSSAGPGARRSMNLSFAQRRRLLQARKSTDQGLLALTDGEGSSGETCGLGPGVTPTPVRATQSSSSRVSIGVLALQQQPDASSSSSLLASGTKTGGASTASMTVAQRILDSLRDVSTPAEMARQRPVSLPPPPTAATAAMTAATQDLHKQEQQQKQALVSKASVVTGASAKEALDLGKGTAATSSSSSSLSRGSAAEASLSTSPFHFTAPRTIPSLSSQLPSASVIATTETTKPVFAFSDPGRKRSQHSSATSTLPGPFSSNMLLSSTSAERETPFSFTVPVPPMTREAMEATQRQMMINPPARDLRIEYHFSNAPSHGTRQRRGRSSAAGASASSSSVVSTTATSSSSTAAAAALAAPSLWALAAQASASTVKCLTCYVQNPKDTTKCLSCESPLTSQSTASATTSQAPAAGGGSSLWAMAANADTIKCQSCLVQNAKTATKCVSCESLLTPTATVTQTVASGGVSFGASTSTSSTGRSSAGGPATSGAAVTGGISSGGFTFGAGTAGATPSTSGSGSVSIAPGGFTFAAPAPSSLIPPSAAAPAKSAMGAFTFGAGTVAPAANAAADKAAADKAAAATPVTSGGFQFGGTAAATANSSFGTGTTGALSSTAGGPAAPFIFGSTAATASTASNAASNDLIGGEQTTKPVSQLQPLFGITPSSSSSTSSTGFAFAPAAGFSSSSLGALASSATSTSNDKKKRDRDNDDAAADSAGPAKVPLTFPLLADAGSAATTVPAKPAAPFMFGTPLNAAAAPPAAAPVSAPFIFGQPPATTATGTTVSASAFTFGAADSNANTATKTSAIASSGSSGNPSPFIFGSGSAAPTIGAGSTIGPPSSSSSAPFQFGASSALPPAAVPSLPGGALAFPSAAVVSSHHHHAAATDSPGSTMDTGYNSSDMMSGSRGAPIQGIVMPGSGLQQNLTFPPPPGTSNMFGNISSSGLPATGQGLGGGLSFPGSTLPSSSSVANLFNSQSSLPQSQSPSQGLTSAPFMFGGSAPAQGQGTAMGFQMGGSSSMQAPAFGTGLGAGMGMGAVDTSANAAGMFNVGSNASTSNKDDGKRKKLKAKRP